MLLSKRICKIPGYRRQSSERHAILKRRTCARTLFDRRKISSVPLSVQVIHGGNVKERPIAAIVVLNSTILINLPHFNRNVCYLLKKQRNHICTPCNSNCIVLNYNIVILTFFFICRFRKLHESGVQNREYKLLYMKKPTCQNGGGNFMSVGLIDCYYAFLVIGFGGLISLIILFSEIIHSKFIRHSN